MVPRLQGASRGESGDSPDTLLTHSEEWVHPGAEASESDKPGQIVSAAPRSSVSPEGDGVSASRDLASVEAWSLIGSSGISGDPDFPPEDPASSGLGRRPIPGFWPRTPGVWPGIRSFTRQLRAGERSALQLVERNKFLSSARLEVETRS